MKISRFQTKRILSKCVDGIIITICTSLMPPVGGFIGIFYILFADGFMTGQSVGKKIFNIKVINIKREPKKCSWLDSTLRNSLFGFVLLLLSFPVLGWFLFFTLGIFIMLFETYLILYEKDGRRIGDILAHTKVVEK